MSIGLGLFGFDLNERERQEYSAPPDYSRALTLGEAAFAIPRLQDWTSPTLQDWSMQAINQSPHCSSTVPPSPYEPFPVESWSATPQLYGAASTSSSSLASLVAERPGYFESPRTSFSAYLAEHSDASTIDNFQLYGQVDQCKADASIAWPFDSDVRNPHDFRTYPHVEPGNLIAHAQDKPHAHVSPPIHATPPLPMMECYSPDIDQDPADSASENFILSPRSSPDKKGTKSCWSKEEDILLCQAVSTMGAIYDPPIPWSMVSSMVPGRSAPMCSKRYHSLCETKSSQRLRTHTRGSWSREEDMELLQKYAECVGRDPVNIPWTAIGASLTKQRTGLQACARYTEALDASIVRGRWSKQEDQLLVRQWQKHGGRWSLVCQGVNGRTQRQCASRFAVLQKHFPHLAEQT